MKVSINIPFWFTTQDRLDNLEASYRNQSELTQFLISKGLDVELKVFESSEDKQYFPSSVYLPEKGEFNKSLRINRALKFLQNTNPDIVSFVDLDCIIERSFFESVYNYLISFKKESYSNSILRKLDKSEYWDKEKQQVTPFYTYKSSGLIDGLGGIWFCDFNTLVSIGGFDEHYTIWGKEDEDVGKRFKMRGMYPSNLPFKIFHLPHTVSTTKENTSLRFEQEEHFTRNNTINRPTLLNNYI